MLMGGDEQVDYLFGVWIESRKLKTEQRLIVVKSLSILCTSVSYKYSTLLYSHPAVCLSHASCTAPVPSRHCA